MAWIVFHQELGTHGKLKRLALELYPDRPDAERRLLTVGHLAFFWWWALDAAPDGQLQRFDAVDLALAAEFCGDAQAFVQALCKARWVDVDEAGGMRIHDWTHYAGKLIEYREKDAARKKAGRAAAAEAAAAKSPARTGGSPAGVPVDHGGVVADVQKTSGPSRNACVANPMDVRGMSGGRFGDDLGSSGLRPPDEVSRPPVTVTVTVTETDTERPATAPAVAAVAVVPPRASTATAAPAAPGSKRAEQQRQQTLADARKDAENSAAWSHIGDALRPWMSEESVRNLVGMGKGWMTRPGWDTRRLVVACALDARDSQPPPQDIVKATVARVISARTKGKDHKMPSDTALTVAERCLQETRVGPGPVQAIGAEKQAELAGLVNGIGGG